MGYAHIFFGWSKRLKPNESRRAFIRSAWLCFAASTSQSHATRAFLDEAIDRSASGSEIPVAVIGRFPVRRSQASAPRHRQCCARPALGQSRRSHRAPVTSGLPQKADNFRTSRHFAFVPIATLHAMSKTAPNETHRVDAGQYTRPSQH